MIELFLLLSISKTFLACSYHQPPVIVSTLPHHVIPGSSLECIAEGEPTPALRWLHNGIEITGERNNVLKVNMSGYFQCEASNHYGMAKSDVVLATQKENLSKRESKSLSWIEPPKTQVAPYGSRVELMCKANRKQGTDIKWYKNGKIVKEATEAVFVIETLGDPDVANYACNVSESFGYVYKNVAVNIALEDVRIKQKPSPDMIVSSGSMVQLPCLAVGYPRPNITWKYNGSIIQNSGNIDINDVNGTLMILKAEPENGGEYNCSAKNHQEDSVKTFLTVARKIKIKNGPSDMNITVFSSVILNCSIVADMVNSITVMWKKNNLDLGLVGISKNKRIDTDENYSLRIRNVTLDDSGRYTCVAFDGTHEVSASATLTVRGFAPILAVSSWPTDKLEGQDVVMECKILEGYPLPIITWEKDGIPLNTTSNSPVLCLDSVKPEYSGDYRCKASNTWGTDTFLIPLRVRRRSRIISTASTYKLVKGESLLINCESEVDKALQESTNTIWYREDERLNATAYKSKHKFLSNGSLIITDLAHSDLGTYSCSLVNRLEETSRIKQGEVISSELELVVLIIILLVLFVIIAISIVLCLTCHHIGSYRVHKAKIKDFSRKSHSNVLMHIPMKKMLSIGSQPPSVGSVTSIEDLLHLGMQEEGSFAGNYQ